MAGIFTRAEVKALGRRLIGDRSDGCGIYSGRVKPKLVELLEVWFPKRKQLEALLVKKE
jgi:hypothetical protein